MTNPEVYSLYSTRYTGIPQEMFVQHKWHSNEIGLRSPASQKYLPWKAKKCHHGVQAPIILVLFAIWQCIVRVPTTPSANIKGSQNPVTQTYQALIDVTRSDLSYVACLRQPMNSLHKKLILRHSFRILFINAVLSCLLFFVVHTPLAPPEFHVYIPVHPDVYEISISWVQVSPSACSWVFPWIKTLISGKRESVS